jgi:putative lumazine-binding protein
VSEFPSLTPSEQALGSEAEIVACVLDYYEGWFDGDAARMERALHPDLVKRTLRREGDAAEALEQDTAQDMIEATARGVGKTRDESIGGDRRIEISVDDVHAGIASVTAHSAVYVDYLQLARTREGWKIVNVLWGWT